MRGGVPRKIIAVDISGRHEHNGEYLMVCAAVLTELTTDNIKSVDDIKIDLVRTEREPEFDVIAETISSTIEGMNDDAVVVAERGELYEKPDWIVQGSLRNEFKYPETISERKALEIAHNAAYEARNLLLKNEKGKRSTG